jgi:hypothetical protein
MDGKTKNQRARKSILALFSAYFVLLLCRTMRVIVNIVMPKAISERRKEAVSITVILPLKSLFLFGHSAENGT